MRKWMSICKKMITSLVLVGIVMQLCGSMMTVHAAEVKKTYPYQVWVNRAQNCTTIYAQDATGAYTVPVKSMLCSVGSNPEYTPLGTFRTSNYYDWRLMVDGSYAQFAVRINGPIMLHSVPYLGRTPDKLETDQFNLLGENASLGCIRFAVSDIKWIYDNCPVGTTVVVYEDFTTPGPLGKPEQMKIGLDHPFAGWDPTDVKVDNPWKIVLPTVYAKINPIDPVLYAPVGATPEMIKTMVGMTNMNGAEIPLNPDCVNINGNYDINTAGLYQVWVQVKEMTTGMMVEKAMTLAVIG